MEIQSDALKNLSDAVRQALTECPVPDVLFTLTEAFAGLSVELGRGRNGSTLSPKIEVNFVHQGGRISGPHSGKEVTSEPLRP